MNFNLLTDAIIPIVSRDKSRQLVSIPELLSAMGKSEVIEISSVKTFQRPAVHQFFVHLAVVALDRAGTTSIEHSADEWRSMILHLAPLHAFDIYSDNPAQAAFLQPPIDPKAYEVARKKTEKHKLCADELTVLIQTKNHSYKYSVSPNGSAWEWACSLIEVQTMSGYEGSGLYGSVRLNGAYGTRFLAGLYGSMHASYMWRRDVSVILRNLAKIREKYLFFSSSSAAKSLLWIEPWITDGQLEFGDLHPMFVDVSRRMRIFVDNNGYRALYTTSKKKRINDVLGGKKEDDRKGNVGDPWLPVRKNKDGYSAITYKTLGLRNIAAIVLGANSHDRVTKPLLMTAPLDGDEAPFFYIAGLIGGQGKTAGFHEVILPTSSEYVSLETSQAAYEKIAANADEMLKDVDVATKALRLAIFVAAQNGSENINFEDNRAAGINRAAQSQFNASIFHNFFDFAWRYGDVVDKETGDVDFDLVGQITNNWRRYLNNLTRETWRRYASECCGRDSSSYKAEAAGDRTLNINLVSIKPENSKGAVNE